jgi:hypothetical protein
MSTTRMETIMRKGSIIKVGLMVGGISLLVNPIASYMMVYLLFGLGWVKEHHGGIIGDGPRANSFLLTVVLSIPEFVWGLVYGAAFFALSKGGKLVGVLTGTIVWTTIPLIVLVNAWIQYDDYVRDLRRWGDEQEALWTGFQDVLAYPLGWFFKEFLTGAIIGLILGKYTLACKRGPETMNP